MDERQIAKRFDRFRQNERVRLVIRPAGARALGAARDCGGAVSPACALRRTRAASSPSRPEAVDEYPAEVPVVRSRNRKAPPRLARGSSPSVSVRPRPWSTPGA